MSSVDIWLLSVAKDEIAKAETLLASFGLRTRWSVQPTSLNTFQTRFQAELDQSEVEQMASDLSRYCQAFEINIDSAEPSLFLFFSGLGLKRLPLDASGEPVIRIGHLESLIKKAQGSNAELARLIRIESATAWLDALEPYRRAETRVGLMPRAV